MVLKNLQKHVRTLAALAETDSQVISCHLSLKKIKSEIMIF